MSPIPTYSSASSTHINQTKISVFRIVINDHSLSLNTIPSAIHSPPT